MDLLTYTEDELKNISSKDLFKASEALNQFYSDYVMRGEFLDDDFFKTIEDCSKVCNTGNIFFNILSKVTSICSKFKNLEEEQKRKEIVNLITYRLTLVEALRELVFVIKLLKLENLEVQSQKDLLEIVCKEKLKEEN